MWMHGVIHLVLVVASGWLDAAFFRRVVRVRMKHFSHFVKVVVIAIASWGIFKKMKVEKKREKFSLLIWVNWHYEQIRNLPDWVSGSFVSGPMIDCGADERIVSSRTGRSHHCFAAVVGRYRRFIVLARFASIALLIHSLFQLAIYFMVILFAGEKNRWHYCSFIWLEEFNSIGSISKVHTMHIYSLSHQILELIY